MDTLIVIVEWCFLSVLGAAAVYLAALSVLSLFARRHGTGGSGRRRKFAVVIPAHNEEATIGNTLRSCGEFSYPAGMFDVVVVADNCTDGTAGVARDLGAQVLERTDPDRRGKGHALRWAFDTLLSREPGYDAFIVVDADSVLTKNFLGVMNGYLDRGARAIQSADLVSENRRSWSSEITRLGFTLYNHVRPLGRKVLGFPAGLRGNGMCFDTALFREIPWNAFGVTEDLQYGLTLLLHGVGVVYAPEAVVYATMPSNARNAVSQRVRWEKGRGPVKKMFSARLLSAALRRRSAAALDAWADLVIPPFVHLMGLIFAATAVHALLAIVAPGTISSFLPAWTGLCAAGIVHVIVGLIAARADAGQYMALAYVPVYAAWKLWTYVFTRNSKTPQEWVRTTREENPAQPAVPEHEGH